MPKNRPPINSEDLSLWDRFTTSITPLKKREKAKPPIAPSLPKTPKKGPKPDLQHRIQQTAHRHAPTPKPVAGQNQLDGKTLSNLRKGKIKVEATIDLHDKNQEQAFHALSGFVTRSFNANKKCVLVITGKGRNSKSMDVFSSIPDGVGVLKTRLPDWVKMAPLNQMVLRIEEAHRKHGGGGAFYLYLKTKSSSQ